jgi:hypothetical protein
MPESSEGWEGGMGVDSVREGVGEKKTLCVAEERIMLPTRPEREL